MQLELREIDDLGEFKLVTELQREAWGMSDLDITPSHVLQAASKTGGQVLGAYTADKQLVAFSLAFLGHDITSARPYLLSHMVAVSPALQSKSVGYEIKLAQKQDALRRGITLIKWTYDPLLSKNANLNLRKLGARVYTFLPNLYGEMRSDLYGSSFPSDRFEVSWDLTEPLPVEFPETAPQLIELQAGAPAVVKHNLTVRREALLCRVPLNHADIRKEDPARALQWQAAIRQISTVLLNGSHVVCGFRISMERDFGEYLFRPCSSITGASL
jgi:predicted GNAT superfamily acetyltransferase